MAKTKLSYNCTACGAISPKWAGQCHDCGAWNTYVEVAQAKPQARAGGYAGTKSEICDLPDVSLDELPRFSTGMSELDRVLGGGLVPGSVVLVGGDPGVGKSTILLQCMTQMSATEKVLYITGEESLQQVALRAKRLELNADKLRLLAETNIESIVAQSQKEKPKVMVVDSIQTIFTDAIQSAPGGVAQVRESAAQLVRFAKQAGVALFLVGHVTKEGALAGPRVLEHMVDAVLYFEGGGDNRFRVLRAVKNRFGAVNELGVFAMTETGLKEVKNPSAIFLTRDKQELPGSVVTVTWEGSRPLLVEVQALVDDNHFGQPKRVCVGLDHNRLALLLATLHRHGGVVSHDQDVFLNVVGGVRVTETSADLALLLSITSSLRDRVLPANLVVFGEVGLGGEIRPVPNGQKRLREAAKHGFTHAIVPKANAPKTNIEGITVNAVASINDALNMI